MSETSKNIGSYFELETYEGKLKSFGDLPSNPAPVALFSVEKKLGLFQHETKGGLKHFLDRSPNDPEHNAYNPVSASFVLRPQPSALSAVA
jgi:hypothetical protein